MEVLGIYVLGMWSWEAGTPVKEVLHDLMDLCGPQAESATCTSFHMMKPPQKLMPLLLNGRLPRVHESSVRQERSETLKLSCPQAHTTPSLSQGSKYTERNYLARVLAGVTRFP